LITDSFNAETGIVMAVLSGKVTMDDFIEWSHILTPARFPVRKLKVIINGTTAKYPHPPFELQKMDKTIADLCSRFESVKLVRVQTKPNETAISKLVYYRKCPLNYSTRIFVSEINAIEWLLET
jgi:hypothetical protein